jgi:DNA-binding MarR family transcriptional regulator
MSDRDHLDEILGQWRRERPDLDVQPLGTVGRILRIAALADGVLGAERAGFGLQAGWFDVLAALRRAGRPYRLTPTQLKGTMLLSSGGVTKRLDRLAEAGLIRRLPDPADRRGTLVELTREGRTVIDRAMAAHVARENGLLAPLDRRERRLLDDLLRKVLTHVEADRRGLGGDSARS